jgi:ribosomal protein S12 methylthiotransferase accessory factor
MEMRIHLDGRKRVSAQFHSFTVHTDQPAEQGGEASAPAPFDLFLASIGTCAGFFVQSFCQTRNIPTDGIEIVQRTEHDPAKHLVSKIRLNIVVPEAFPAKYRAGLVNAAYLCTVKRHLQDPPVFEVETQVAQAPEPMPGAA